MQPACTSILIEEIRKHAAGDEEYQQIRKFIVEGFPKHRSELPVLCRHYWHVRQHLSTNDGLIVCGCWLLIPVAMRREVLQILHKSHQGNVRTKERARLAGIDSDIDNLQDALPSK